MRFTLESSSEASVDEYQQTSQSHTLDGPTPAPRISVSMPATPTSSTPRKGILRKPNIASASKDQSLTLKAASFAPPDLPPNVARNGSPALSPVRSRTPGGSRSRTSAILSFELVGLPCKASSSKRGTKSVSKSSPAWMRSQLEETSRNLPRPSGRYVSEDSSDDDSDELSSSLSDSSTDSDSSPISSSIDEDFSDSEEEEWPVEPGRIGSSALSSNGKSKGRRGRRSRDLARSIRLASVADDWEDWDRASRETAWDRATSSYATRLRSHTTGEDGLTPASLISPLQHRTSLPTLKPPSSSSIEAELDEVRKLLGSLNVKREDEEKKEREAFEARNRALWQDIDASILAAEKEAKEAAAAEAQRLEAARKAQEDAERKAREARENEQKRIEVENKAKQEEEEKGKEEEQKKQEEEARQKEKKKAMGGGGAEIKKAAQQEYEDWVAKITHIKQNVLPIISQNPELRKQCFAAKRQITPKVGQLTNSKQEIVRITTAIESVLSAAKGASATGEIYTWILNHLSKCLIRQAEQEVAAKQDTAYPLARVVVWLFLQGHQELGEVLMARLVKKCCWCLAYWPGKKAGEDDVTYRKTLGYKSSDESSENYTNRMMGIFAFFVAILQTKPTPPPGASSADISLIPEHVRSKTLWAWSVRTLSAGAPILSHPLLPSLWSTFLEVGGNSALAVYGKQMAKIWKLMLDEGLRGKKAGFVEKEEKEGYVKASIVRLQLLLEGWEKQGKIVEATKGSEMEDP